MSVGTQGAFPRINAENERWLIIYDSSRVFGLYAWCEVPFGKGAAGAGLEIPLEAARRSLVGELELNDEAPRPVRFGVAARSTVMPFKAAIHACRDPNIVASWVRLAPQDVHESQRICGHALGERTNRSQRY